MKTIEQGIEEIMLILEGKDKGHGGNEQGAGAGAALDNSTVTSKAPSKPKQETIYDAYGHPISVNGKKTNTGYTKNAKRVKTAKDAIRADLLNATEVLLAKSKAFEGKVGRNKVDGVIIRLADADYTVKVMGHEKKEFENREEGFRPEISYMTRGKVENHSSAIAKIIVAEFGIQFSCASFCGFENENPFVLLDGKASAIRIGNGDLELSFKITKKRARVVME